MEQLKKYQYIDEIRGIAILLVILVHTAQRVKDLGDLGFFTKYGQMGVQLFFVASAFTLCHSFLSRRNEKHPVKSFYIRRFFRIAPMYYLGIAIYFCWLIVPQLFEQNEINFKQYQWLNVLSNIFFFHGFYPPGNNNIVFGGWSIGTEMAFYLIFPAIFMFVFKDQEGEAKKALILLFISVLFNFSFLYWLTEYAHVTFRNNSFWYYNIVNQLPVFLTGILLFTLIKKTNCPSLLKSVSFSAIIFVTFTTISIFLWLEWRSKWTFSVIPLISAVSFIALLNLFRLKKSSSKFLAKIGKVSYSMYIVHFLFAWHICPRIMKKFFSDLSPEPKLLISIVLVIGFSFIFALITERFVETKGIALGKRIVSRLQGR